MSIDKHTPDWQWLLNESGQTVTLQSTGSGRDTIMDFVRYGMRFAQPRFNVNGIMIPASELGVVVEGREHHKEWFKFINHPTAQLIASAPSLLAENKRLREALEKIEKVSPSNAPFVDDRLDYYMVGVRNCQSIATEALKTSNDNSRK